MPRAIRHDQKNLMLIGDMPTAIEENSQAWSSASSTKFLDMLSMAGDIVFPMPGTMNYRRFRATYLTYNRPNDDDSEFKTSLKTGSEVRKYMLAENGGLYHHLVGDTYCTAIFQTTFDELLAEICEVQPKLLVITGKFTLALLTGVVNITNTRGTPKDKRLFGALSKYRASIMQFSQELTAYAINKGLILPDCVIVPMLDPRFHHYIESDRLTLQYDYIKVAKIYQKILANEAFKEASPRVAYDAATAVTYISEILTILRQGKTKVSIDVETRYKHIDAMVIYVDEVISLVIPFTKLVFKTVMADDVDIQLMKELTNKYEPCLEVSTDTIYTEQVSYWSIEEETEILYLVQRVLLHENCLHVGQNYNYDSAYLLEDFRILCLADEDTMTQQHVIYNYAKKKLDYIASLYVLDYVYWKDGLYAINEKRWEYCWLDGHYTMAAHLALEEEMLTFGTTLYNFYRHQVDDTHAFVFSMGMNGWDIDIAEKERLHSQFTAIKENALTLFKSIIGQDINVNSSTQIKQLFVDFFGIKPVLDPKRKTPSFGRAAVLQYIEEYPHLRPLLLLLIEYKSVKVFTDNFLAAKIYPDGKFRWSYNIDGTKTYRFGASTDAFGFGQSPLNLPSKGKLDIKWALEQFDNETTTTTDEVSSDEN